MKKAFMMFLCVVSALGLGVTAEAQITISTNDFLPPVGSSVGVVQLDVVTEDLFDAAAAVTGGGNTWDFSELTTSGPLPGVMVDPFTAPAIDSFPGANLVIQYVFGTDTSWNFIRSVPTAYEELGAVSHVGGFPIQVNPTNYSIPLYSFPIDFNDSWSTTNNSVLELGPGIRTETYDTTFFSVDAYGTLSYNGNSMACLRFTVVQRIHAVSIVNNIPFSTTLSTTERLEFVGSGFSQAVLLGRTTLNGSVSYFGYGLNAFVNTPTDIVQNDPDLVPGDYELSQNYPNPFNPETNISFGLPEQQHVDLTVYNVLGQSLATLVDQSLPAGNYTVSWDGTDRHGNAMASGVYLYRLQAGTVVDTRKMMLVK